MLSVDSKTAQEKHSAFMYWAIGQSLGIATNVFKDSGDAVPTLTYNEGGMAFFSFSVETQRVTMTCHREAWGLAFDTWDGWLVRDGNLILQSRSKKGNMPFHEVFSIDKEVHQALMWDGLPLQLMSQEDDDGLMEEGQTLVRIDLETKVTG